MNYQFFTIPVFTPGEGQAALNKFCNQHRVVTVEKQFVGHGTDSAWTLCVSYMDGAGELPQTPLSPSGNKRDSIDYKEVLNAHDFAIYAGLRALRKTLAQQENIPAYALFNNEQLAAMVTGETTTLTALSEIDGVGKARLEKYGEVFISELQRLLATTPVGNDETPPDPTV